MFGIQTFLLLATLVNLVFGTPVPSYEDQEYAASENLGRVQIKVFRGPTEHDGHEDFAPWGYWVKQPGDDHHH